MTKKDQLKELEELKEKVIALRKKGLTYREIEEELAISPFNYEVELAKINRTQR